MLKKIAPYIILIISVIAFFPTIIFSGHTFIFSGLVLSDLFGSNYPSKVLLHTSLQSGQGIPFWTDQIGDGYPYFAEGGLAALYPINQLVFRLPIDTMTGFNAVLMYQYVIAAIGMYLYITKSLKLQAASAVMGSIVFTFCGYMLMRIQHTNIILVVSYLPLKLLVTDFILKTSWKANKKKMILWTLIMIALLYLQQSVGSIEFAYYNILFTSVYVIIRLIFNTKLFDEIVPKLAAIVISTCIAILLIAPQIMGTLELTKFSQREEGVTDEEATIEQWPLKSLIFFINPRAYPLFTDNLYYKIDDQTVNTKSIYTYIGIIPILLVFIALISSLLKKEHDLRNWTFVFIAYLLLVYIYAIGSSTQFYYFIRDTVPGMSFFRLPLKSVYSIEFSLAALASIGFEQILRRQHTFKRLGIVIGIIGIAYLDLWISSRPILPTIKADNWLKAPPTAEYITRKYGKDPFHNWRVYSQGADILGSDRILDFDLQNDLKKLIHQDINMLYNIDLNQSYTGLVIQKHRKINSYKIKVDYNKNILVLPPEMKKSLDLQSVRFILSDIPIVNDSLILQETYPYKKGYKHKVENSDTANAHYIYADKAYLYENTTYVPRVSIIPQSNAIYIKDSDEIYKRMIESDFDIHTGVIIEAPKDQISASGNTNHIRSSTYKAEMYTAQDMTFSVTVDEPSYFVMSDINYPGWHAEVDKKVATIERANYDFRAIKIPIGEHALHMYYEPTYWKGGVIIQLLALAAVITCSIVVCTDTILKTNKEKND